MIVAINQPYFSPYSGYFSLMASAEVFVLYDCVQFMRRGRIHRSQVQMSSSYSAGWLTLPIVKAPQDTKILDMRLNQFGRQKFGQYGRMIDLLATEVDIPSFSNAKESLSNFLDGHLRAAALRLRHPVTILRSSSLNIPSSITGQARIIEICQRLGAKDYINLPGGRALYDEAAFLHQGIRLKFLNTDCCGRQGYLQAWAEGRLDQFASEAGLTLFAK